MGPVLVTGGTGFVGRHVVRELAHAGYQLRLLVRNLPASAAEDDHQYITGDLLDPVSLGNAMLGADAVVHAAGFVSTNPRDRKQIFDVNVTGTRNLLDAARTAGVKRVVFTSSTSAVGALATNNLNATLAEDAVYDLDRLNVPYVSAKRLAHQMALEARSDDFEIVVLSPTLILGPGEGPAASSHALVKAFLKGKIPAVPPGGVNVVDVRDLARSYVAALQHPAPSPHYIVGGPENMTLGALFQRLEGLSGINAPSLRIPGWCAVVAGHVSQIFAPKGALSVAAAKMGRLYWYFNSTAAQRDLGHDPRPLDETLATTIAWIRR